MIAVSLFAQKGDKSPIQKGALVRMKNAVLGRGYSLSVAFVRQAEMRRLNATYRNIPHTTDVLSFPLSPVSGEVLFCMKEVQKQAPRFKRTPSNFFAFLFIHGLFHLKGYRHGSRMERLEAKFRKQFGI